MSTRVKEIRQGLTLPACQPPGCCSVHRRPDRVYEDRLWAWSLVHVNEKPHR